MNLLSAVIISRTSSASNTESIQAQTCNYRKLPIPVGLLVKEGKLSYRDDLRISHEETDVNIVQEMVHILLEMENV